MKLKNVFEYRVGLFVLFVLILISISFLVRVMLLIKSAGEVDFTLQNILGLFFIGLLSDLITAAYASVPLVLYLWLIPERIFRRPGRQGLNGNTQRVQAPQPVVTMDKMTHCFPGRHGIAKIRLRQKETQMIPTILHTPSRFYRSFESLNSFSRNAGKSNHSC